jgi:hypothetical protein
LAKPNYQYEKRQKDLAKKRKQEEKRLRKLEKHAAATADDPGQASQADQAAQAQPPVSAPDKGEAA